ncbi:VOC family protein [Mycobacterium branderi]|uniref:Glyoxalase n=1 Tax=Mycobacterium branderi TaxID=43348 RepID=A0A7I7WG73_9MYCO|nr:VOC family protein [Mycobacterium branderi]MCV7231796.1 VOC family protein [Mycobacterium branderi]ORA40245.1 hypothetical protein BST20_06725 [Mycobacterium branderi]BBZ15551.1 hypothetical protein MBRA_57460 [Mycobacterium branderi]
MLQPPGSVIEIAHVVDDLDAAIGQFIELWGAGPFYSAPMRFPTGHHYRGKEAPLAIDVGFGFSGGLLIELIQPLDGDRSVFSEALAARGPGFHHIVRREPYEKGVTRCEQAGFGKALELTTAFGERTVLFDTTALNGGFLEVVDLHVTFEPLLATLSQAHDGWDGERPRRSLSALFDYAGPDRGS